MAWFDDRTPRHPKIRKLSPVSFQWWFDLICYCSEFGTGGRADEALEALRMPSPTRSALLSAGLLEEDQDGVWVHDWQEYNGKRETALEERRAQARERQRRHREKVRARSVTRDTGVTEAVTQAVTVTRDIERDTSRAPAGPRPNDHDHDQEEQAGRQTSEVDVPGLPADEQHEDPEPSLEEESDLGQIGGSVQVELRQLRRQEATT